MRRRHEPNRAEKLAPKHDRQLIDCQTRPSRCFDPESVSMDNTL